MPLFLRKEAQQRLELEKVGTVLSKTYWFSYLASLSEEINLNSNGI